MGFQAKNEEKVAQIVSEAVYMGNGNAITTATKALTDEFVLIRKSDLPAVVAKKEWREEAIPVARSAAYRGMKPSVYWERALDFIAISLHAEVEEGKQAERELAWKRADAYRMLYPKYPHAPLWSYEGLDAAVKAQVDVVVGMMTQVDELKDKK